MFHYKSNRINTHSVHVGASCSTLLTYVHVCLAGDRAVGGHISSDRVVLLHQRPGHSSVGSGIVSETMIVIEFKCCEIVSREIFECIIYMIHIHNISVYNCFSVLHIRVFSYFIHIKSNIKFYKQKLIT